MPLLPEPLLTSDLCVEDEFLAQALNEIVRSGLSWGWRQRQCALCTLQYLDESAMYRHAETTLLVPAGLLGEDAQRAA